MPRKRKPMSQPPKDEELKPLRVAAPRRAPKRPWYHAPLALAAHGVTAVLGIFRRRPRPVVIQKKPPRPRRKRK